MWQLRIVFATSRGLRNVALHTLAAFGLFSALIQFYSAVWVPSHALRYHALLALCVGIMSIAYGVYRAWPKRTIKREFRKPEMSVTVTVADILNQDGQLVVGFSDTFDTQTIGGIIDPQSLQGQLLSKVYSNDVTRLDTEIGHALSGVPVLTTENMLAKKGKLQRYSVGTVAVLNAGTKKIYAVAYSIMDNNLVAKSSVQQLWMSLDKLWDAVYINGQRAALFMPLVGTELARINCLDRESLLKMILLSFVSRSREDLFCKDFRVVIHPKDYDKINMPEVGAFLMSL